MRKAPVIILTVASAEIFACGLFPDLSSLSESDGATTDAANDASISADADAGKTDSGDAAVIKDAGSDGDAAALFCVTNANHTFCEDFDEPGFATRWNGVVTTPDAGTAVESDASSVSAPNELLTTATYPPNTNGLAAYAYKHFTTAKTLKLQVALLVEAATMANFDPVEISFTPPAAYKSYQIHIDVATQHVGYTTAPADGGSAVTTDTPFTSTFATWRNLELDLDLTTSAFQILVDGTQVVSWTVAPLAPTAFDIRLGVVLGVSGSTPTTSIVHVDNVLVDTTQ